jgi:signal transduction histidine kinase
MIILRVILLFFFILNFISTSKSASQADSLEQSLKTATDTNKVNILNKLSMQYFESNGPKAIEFARQAIELSKTLNFQIGIVKAYNNIGIVHDVTGKYDSALYNYGLSLELSTKLNNKKQMANTLNNIGLVHWNKGEFDNALDYYLKSLKLFEDIDNKKGVANTLSNIGLIYTDLKKYKEALDYHIRALKMREQINDQYGIGVSQNNIGLTYGYMKEYALALEYVKKALVTKQHNNDLYGQGITLSDIGVIYGGFKKYDLAIEYQLQSLAIRSKLNDKLGMANSYCMIAADYGKKGDYKTAIEYNLKALELANQLKAKKRLKKIYAELSHDYKKLSNYQKSLEYLEKYAKLNDTIYSEESASKIAEMQTRYETEKKDLEITRKDLEINNNQLELTKQKNQRTILLICILGICIIFYLLYARYKFKQKSILSQELLRQQELRSKAVIEAEENERARIARELHDGIGQHLSAVKLNLSNLESLLHLKNEDEKKLMSNALNIIDDSVKEVRHVSHSMIPGALMQAGLEPALRDFLNRLQVPGKLTIDFEAHGLGSQLESTTEIILFRVVQEAVNNVLKHAQASLVNIQLIQHENELVLMVEDNGIGFNQGELKKEGIGLKNIRSRIAYLNGTLNIDSQPNNGTTITIEIPLKKHYL